VSKSESFIAYFLIINISIMFALKIRKTKKNFPQFERKRSTYHYLNWQIISLILLGRLHVHRDMVIFYNEIWLFESMCVLYFVNRVGVFLDKCLFNWFYLLFRYTEMDEVEWNRGLIKVFGSLYVFFWDL
jgi:hypothetical protein